MSSVAPVPATPRPPAADQAPPTGNMLIARMGVTADLTDEAAMPRGADRKSAVYQDLVDTARTSQADALAKLGELQAAGDVTAVESLFLPNAIVVTTAAGRHQSVADALAGVANVEAVGHNSTFSLPGGSGATATGAAGAAAGAGLLLYARSLADGPKTMATGGGGASSVMPTPAATSGSKVEWGVQQVRAPEAWAGGADGSGVTVGVVDTGLDASHPAIKPHYRGTQADGSQVHDYNWFDPLTGSAAPSDAGSHGTHVAGTVAGGTPEHAIGVAPGARIIAARAIDETGYNTTVATLRALQFMLAPTKTDGSDPDPAKGADVVNNSWGNSTDRADTTFVETFAGLKAAGIEVVTSTGNDGPSDGSISAPGSHAGHLSVGATTADDEVAPFSSRGVSVATPEEMTPNVSAPGADVLSAVPGGGYVAQSGTSMAAPHVTGAVAALLSKFPQATHGQLVEALTKTAVDIDAPGADTGSGYGRIDVAAAVQHLAGAAGAPEAAS